MILIGFSFSFFFSFTLLLVRKHLNIFDCRWGSKRRTQNTRCACQDSCLAAYKGQGKSLFMAKDMLLHISDIPMSRIASNCSIELSLVCVLVTFRLQPKLGLRQYVLDVFQYAYPICFCSLILLATFSFITVIQKSQVLKLISSSKFDLCLYKFLQLLCLLCSPPTPRLRPHLCYRNYNLIFLA